MAMLKIYIPQSQFEEGGRFESHAERPEGVQVPFVSVAPTINVKRQAQYFEESRFHPSTNRAYSADLDAIRKGLIKIEKNGVEQTPEDMITLFKTYFQEL